MLAFLMHRRSLGRADILDMEVVDEHHSGPVVERQGSFCAHWHDVKTFHRMSWAMIPLETNIARSSSRIQGPCRSSLPAVT